MISMLSIFIQTMKEPILKTRRFLMPVQIYSKFHNYSKVSPMLFRFEDSINGIQILQINKIISCKSFSISGMKYIQYLCNALINNEEATLELIYNVEKHRWLMFEPSNK